MNLPPCIIQSRRNGKFYTVSEETGEIELENSKYMSVIDLFPYDLVDKNERFWTYKLRPNSTFLQKLKKIKNQLTPH